VPKRRVFGTLRSGRIYLETIQTCIEKLEKELNPVAVEKQTAEVLPSTMAHFANLHQIWATNSFSSPYIPNLVSDLKWFLSTKYCFYLRFLIANNPPKNDMV
jgi:hypothetical protein